MQYVEREDIRISWFNQLRGRHKCGSFANEECIFSSNVAPNVMFPRLHPCLVPFGTISSIQLQYSRNQWISHLALRAIIAPNGDVRTLWRYATKQTASSNINVRTLNRTLCVCLDCIFCEYIGYPSGIIKTKYFYFFTRRNTSRF